MKKRIAILGGGVSGTLAAIHIAKESAVEKIYLIESNPERLFKGFAYSSNLPYQPLNVPAQKMSLFSNEPNHFVEWLVEKGFYPSIDNCKNEFVARNIFGQYIQESFEKGASEKISIVLDAATNIKTAEEKIILSFDKTPEIAVDTLVLCTGNLPSRKLEKPHLKIIEEPWGGKQTIDSNAKNILVVGAGLTMVDAVLSLKRNGCSGKITVLSRRGKTPLPHGESTSWSFTTNPLEEAKNPLSALRWFRKEVSEAEKKNTSFRSVIDALRPVTEAIWKNWNTEEQTQFLRHLAVYWDIHRHRMPQVSYAQIQELMAAKKLEIKAGRVSRIASTNDAHLVYLKYKNEVKETETTFDYIINCTGPAAYSYNAPVFLKSLIEEKKINFHPNNLGIQTDENGFLVGAKNSICKNIICIGGLRKPSDWESTALKEIREQTEKLCQLI